MGKQNKEKTTEQVVNQVEINNAAKATIQPNPDRSAKYDYGASYLKAKAVDSTEEFVPYTPYMIHKDNNFGTPVMPTIEQFREEAKVYGITDDNAVKQMYNEAALQATKVAVKDYSDTKNWMLNRPFINEKRTPFGTMAPGSVFQLEKPIDMGNDGLGVSLSQQEKLETNPYYRKKNGDFDFLDNFDGTKDGTVLVKDPFGEENIWTEKSDTEYHTEIRSVYGANSIKANPLEALGKGLLEGSLGSLVMAGTQGVASLLNTPVSAFKNLYAQDKNSAVYKALDSAQKSIDGYGNWGSNLLGYYMPAKSEEEQKSFLDNPSSFFNVLGNAMGQSLTMLGASGMVAKTAMSVGGEAIAGTLAKNTATGYSGLMGAGYFYDEAKSNNIDLDIAAPMALAMGIAIHKIEDWGGNYFIGGQALKADMKKINQEINKDIADYVAKNGLLDKVGKAQIIKKYINKPAELLENYKTKDGMAGWAGRVMGSSYEEFIQEGSSQAMESTFKALYNDTAGIVQKNNDTAYQEEAENTQKELAKYTISGDEKSGKTLYFKDGKEISEETFKEDRRLLRNKSNKINAAKLTLDEGNGLFTGGDWDKIGSNTWEAMISGGSGGGATAMFTQRRPQRRQTIVDYASQGKVDEIENELKRAYEKEGLAPKNISAQTGLVFTTDAPRSKENPSLNDIAYNNFTTEINMVKEVMNTDFKNFNPTKFNGTKEMYNDVNRVVIDRINNEFALNKKKEELKNSQGKTEDEVKAIEADIENLNAVIETNKDEYDRLTNPNYQLKDENGNVIESKPNTTGYSLPFLDLAKENVIKQTFNDATQNVMPEDIKAFNERKQVDLEQKARANKIAIENSMKGLDFTDEDNTTSKLLKFQQATKSWQTTPGAQTPENRKKMEKTLNEVKDELLQQSETLFDRTTEDLFNEIPTDSGYNLDSFKKAYEQGEDEQLFDMLSKNPKFGSFEDVYEGQQRIEQQISGLDPFTVQSKTEEEFLGQTDDEYLNDKYSKLVEELESLTDDDLSTPDVQANILKVSTELEADSMVFKAKEAYDKIKNSKIEANVTQELKKLSNGTFDGFKMKQDNDIKEHIVLDENKRLEAYQKLAELKNKVDNIKAKVSKATNSQELKDVNFKAHDVKSKHAVISNLMTAEGVLNSFDKDTKESVLSLLNSEELTNNLAIATDINATIAEREDARIKASVVLTRIEYALYKNRAKVFTKENLTSAFKKIYVKSNYKYSDLKEFDGNDLYEMIVSGTIYDDSKKGLDKNTLNLIYTMNYLSQLNSFNPVAFQNKMQELFNISKNEVPTYEQRNAIKDIAAALNGFNIVNEVAFNFLYTEDNLRKDAIDGFNNNAVVIRGFAGTGKTTVALKFGVNLYALMNDKKFVVHSFVPGQNQIPSIQKGLEQAIEMSNGRIESKSINVSADIKAGLNAVNQDDIIVVDEVTLFSANDLALIKEKGAKVIFLGDESQSTELTGSATHPVFEQAIRSMPFTQVFRTGVLKLWDFQKGLRTLTSSSLQGVKAQKAKIVWPSFNFFSDGKHKIGLQYSQTKEELIGTWVEHAKETTDAVLVVETDQERNDIIAKYQSVLGANIGNLVFTVSGTQARIQGLSRPYVYSAVTLADDNSKQAVEIAKARDVYTIATRPVFYLNQLETRTSIANVGTQEATADKVIVIAEKTDEEKAKFSNAQKELFKKEVDAFNERFPSPAKEAPTSNASSEPQPPQPGTPPTPPQQNHGGSLSINFAESKKHIESKLSKYKSGEYTGRYGEPRIEDISFKISTTKKGKKIQFKTSNSDKWLDLTEANLAANQVFYVDNITKAIKKEVTKDVDSLKVGKDIINVGETLIVNDREVVVKRISETTRGTQKDFTIFFTDGTSIDKKDFVNYKKPSLKPVEIAKLEGLKDVKNEMSTESAKELNDNGRLTMAHRLFGSLSTGGIDLELAAKAKASVTRILMDKKGNIDFQLSSLKELGLNLFLLKGDTEQMDGTAVYVNLSEQAMIDAQFTETEKAEIRQAKQVLNSGDNFLVSMQYSSDVDKYNNASEIAKDVKDGVISIERGKHLATLFFLKKGRAKRSVQPTLVRSGHLSKKYNQQGKTSISLKDFKEKNSEYYDFSHFIQKVYKETLTTIAVFKNKLGHVKEDLGVYVKTNTITKAELNDLKVNMAKNPAGNSSDVATDFNNVDLLPGHQFIKYNSAIIKFFTSDDFINDNGDSGLKGLVTFDNVGININGKSPKDKHANILRILDIVEKIGVDNFYVNPVEKSRNDGQITMADDNDFNPTTNYHTIQDPIISFGFTSGNVEDFFDGSVLDEYKATITNIENAQSNSATPKTSKINKGKFHNKMKSSSDSNQDLDYVSNAEGLKYVDDLLGFTGTDNLEIASSITDANGNAVHGVVRSGKIFLESVMGSVSKKVAAHEIVHFVNNYLLTKKERQNLYKAVNSIFKTGNPEEFLAETVETYNAKTKKFDALGNMPLPGKIKDFFQRIIKFFTGIQTDADQIHNHLTSVLDGKFKNATRVSDSEIEMDEDNYKQKNFANSYEVHGIFGGDYNYYRVVRMFSDNVISNSAYGRDVANGNPSSLEDAVSNMIEDFKAEAEFVSNDEVNLSNGISKAVKDVLPSEIQLIEDRDQLVNTLIYVASLNQNYSYIVKSALPGFNVDKDGNIKQSKKGEGVVRKENTMKDGIGGVSAKFKFVVGSHVNSKGDFIDVNYLIDNIRSVYSNIMNNSQFRKYDESGKDVTNHVEALRDGIDLKISELKEDKNLNSQKSMLDLIAFKDMFLRQSTINKDSDLENLSYYDLAFNSKNVKRKANEILSAREDYNQDELNSLIKQKEIIANEVFTGLAEIMSLEATKNVSMKFLYGSKFRPVRYKESNAGSIIKEHRSKIAQNMYVGNVMNANRLMDFLGLKFENDIFVADKDYVQKIKVEQNKVVKAIVNNKLQEFQANVIYTNYKEKNIPVIYYTKSSSADQKGKLVFNLHPDFINSNQSAAAIRDMFIRMGIDITEMQINTLMATKNAYNGDEEINSTMLIRALGGMALSSFNMAHEYLDTHNKEAIAKGEKALEKKYFPSNTPNILETEKDLQATFGVSKNEEDYDNDDDGVRTKMVGPQDLYRELEAISKYQAVSMSRGRKNFSTTPEGNTMYNTILNDNFSKTFNNPDNGQAASSGIVSIIEKQVQLKPNGNLLTFVKNNLLMRDRRNSIKKIERFNGTIGKNKGNNFNDTTTNDLINSVVNMFMSGFMTSTSLRKTSLPFELMGERNYLRMAEMEFSEKVFTEFDKHKKDGQIKITATVNDKFFENETSNFFNERKEIANKSFDKFLDAASAIGLNLDGNIKNVSTAISDFNAIEKTQEEWDRIVRYINSRKDIVNGVDVIYNHKDKSINVGRAVSSFYKIGKLPIDKDFNTFNYDDWFGGKYDTISKEVGMSKLDVLFSEHYTEFNNFLRESGHHSTMSEFLYKGMGDYAFEKNGIELERQILGKSKINDKYVTLHPVYKGLFHTFMMMNRSANPFFMGGQEQFKDYFQKLKRAQPLTSPHNRIPNYSPLGIGKTLKSIVWNDELPGTRFTRFSEIANNFSKKMDGAMMLNPVTHLQILATSKDLTGEGVMKTILSGTNIENNSTIVLKSSLQPLTNDYTNYVSDEDEQLMGTMFYDGIRNPFNPVYTKYLELTKQGLQVQESAQVIYDMIVEDKKNGGNMSQYLIDMIGGVSSNKIDSGYKETLTNDFMLSSGIQVNEYDSDNFGVQMNPEQDYEKTEASNPSQIVSILSLAKFVNAEKAYKAFSNIAENGMQEIKDQIKNSSYLKWAREVSIENSNGKMTAFNQMVNNRRISMQLAPMFVKNGYDVISRISKFTRPKMNGVRMTQANDVFTKIYATSDGRRLTKNEAKNTEGAIERELQPMTYFADGVQLNTKQEVLEAIRDGKELKTKPQEVLMAYSYFEKFNINGMTLDKAMTFNGIPLNGKTNEEITNIIAASEEILDSRGGLITDIASAIKYYQSFNKSLDVFTNRIPSHSFASGQIGRVVGFINGSKNTIITSSERTLFDGSDFDIDQLTVFFADIDDDLNVVQSEEMNIFNSITDSYSNPTAETLLLMITEMDLESLRRIVDNGDKSKIHDRFNSIVSTLANHKSVNDGKSMVGLFANLMKFYGNINYVVRGAKNSLEAKQLSAIFGGFNTKYVLNQEAYDASVEGLEGMPIQKLEKTLELNEIGLAGDNKQFYYQMNDVNSDGEHVLNVIGKFLNASTDNAKEFILGFMNINKASFELVSSMILSGDSIQKMHNMLTKNSDVTSIIKSIENSQSVRTLEASESMLERVDELVKKYTSTDGTPIDLQIAAEEKYIESLNLKLKAARENVNKPNEENLVWNVDAQEYVPADLAHESETEEDRMSIDEIESAILGSSTFLNQLISDKTNGTTVVKNEKRIKEIQEVRGYLYKGAFINRMNIITKLNQKIEGAPYELDIQQIEAIEYILRKDLEDVFNFNVAKKDWKQRHKYLSKKKFAKINLKDGHLMNDGANPEVPIVFPDIEKLIAQIPHLKTYVEVLKDIKGMRKENIRYNPTIQKLKSSLLNLFGKTNFRYKTDYNAFIDSINDLMTGTYFDKHENKDLSIINSFNQKQHNLGTAEGRMDFSDDFPEHVRKIKNDYSSAIEKNSNMRRNEFLESINVVASKNGTNNIILIGGSDMSDAAKSKVQNGFNSLHDTLKEIYSVQENTVFIKNYSDVELKDLFRAYDMIRYAGSAKADSISEVIGKNVLTEQNTLIERMSDYIDGELIPNLNKLNTFSEEQITANSELKTLKNNLENLKNSLVTDNDLVRTLKEEDLEAVREEMKSEKLYDNTGKEISRDEFIELYLPKYIKEFNKDRKQYEIKKRFIDAENNIRYGTIYSKHNKISKNFTDTEQYLKTPVLKTGVTMHDVHKLNNGQTVNVIVPNVNSLFAEGQQGVKYQENTIYIPRVGYVKAVRGKNQSANFRKITDQQKAVEETKDFKQSKDIGMSKKVGEETINYLVEKLQKLNPNLSVMTLTNDEVLMMDEKYHGLKGWTENGIVYLNEDFVTADTLVHEISHIFINDLEVTNPELYNNLKQKALQDLADETNDLANRVKAGYAGSNENDLAQEYMATVIGLGSVGKIEALDKNANKIGLFEALIDWIKQRIFGLDGTIKEFSDTDIMNMSLMEFGQVFSEQILDYGYFNYNFNTSNNPEVLIMAMMKSGEITSVDEHTLEPCK